MERFVITSRSLTVHRASLLKTLLLCMHELDATCIVKVMHKLAKTLQISYNRDKVVHKGIF